MFIHHFGLTGLPLLSSDKPLWDDGQLSELKMRVGWLLEHPGVGLITGEAGVGKTSALRQCMDELNPHHYKIIYQSENDFSRLDVYRQFAEALGLTPAYKRAQLWRDIKERITELVDTQRVLPIWILDEAQNLPLDFFKDLPSFLNFAFDTRSLLSIWLVGFPQLQDVLSRNAFQALHSRIQVKVRLQPIWDGERFKAMIEHAFKEVGCQQTLMSDSGIEAIRLASKGKFRQAGQIIRQGLRLAAKENLNHITDEIIECAIEECKK